MKLLIIRHRLPLLVLSGERFSWSSCCSVCHLVEHFHLYASKNTNRLHFACIVRTTIVVIIIGIFNSRKILHPSPLWLSWLEGSKVIFSRCPPQITGYRTVFMSTRAATYPDTASSWVLMLFDLVSWVQISCILRYFDQRTCFLMAPPFFFSLQIPFQKKSMCSIKFQNQKDDNEESDVSQ